MPEHAAPRPLAPQQRHPRELAELGVLAAAHEGRVAGEAALVAGRHPARARAVGLVRAERGELGQRGQRGAAAHPPQLPVAHLIRA